MNKDSDPEKASDKSIEKALKGIERETIRVEKKIAPSFGLGLSTEEYGELSGGIPVAIAEPLEPTEEKATGDYEMKDFLGRYEEIIRRITDKFEQIPPSVQVVDNTPYNLSNSLVSYVMQRARENPIYQKDGNNKLADFRNIKKISILKKQDASNVVMLQFYVYIEKKNFPFMKKTKDLMVLYMYPSGSVYFLSGI